MIVLVADTVHNGCIILLLKCFMLLFRDLRLRLWTSRFAFAFQGDVRGFFPHGIKLA